MLGSGMMGESETRSGKVRLQLHPDPLLLESPKDNHDRSTSITISL